MGRSVFGTAKHFLPSKVVMKAPRGRLALVDMTKVRVVYGVKAIPVAISKWSGSLAMPRYKPPLKGARRTEEQGHSGPSDLG